MPDGRTIVLVSTKGKLNDVPADVMAFLNYVEGTLSQDEFVMKIDKAVQEIKAVESERVSYMTFGGTGCRMWIKGKPYEILAMQKAEHIATSTGVPGAVINKFPDGAVMIKVKDTAVIVEKIQDDTGTVIVPGKLLRIGMRL